MLDEQALAATASQQTEEELRPLAVPTESWAGLPMTLERLPASLVTCTPVQFPDAMLAVARRGRGQRRFTSGLRTRDLYSAPRMIEFYSAGYELDRAIWRGDEGEVITVRLPAAAVARLAADRPMLNLGTQHEVFDERIADLVRMMWTEAENVTSQGALYAQGLTLALIGVLTTGYGAKGSGATPHVHKFSARERSHLRQFIDQELSKKLSVERLAALVGMSPDYFARAFRASFDCAPYAFVLDKRIEATCRQMILDPGRAIADIAIGAGFSSQAHFTDAFRKKLGVTPARWRRGLT